MVKYIIISSRHGRLVYKYSDLTEACREWLALVKRFGHYGVTFHIEEVRAALAALFLLVIAALSVVVVAG